jgi:tetratricopeptide (TPR) repeat protein
MGFGYYHKGMRKKVLIIGTVLALAICAGGFSRRWIAFGLDRIADGTNISVLRDIAVVVAPDDPNVYLERGTLGDVNEAIEVDPRCAEAYRRRAAFMEASVAQADDLTRAIRLERNPEDYLRRGECYLLARRNEDAEADFEVASRGCGREVLIAAARKLIVEGKKMLAQDAALALPYFRGAETLSMGPDNVNDLKEVGKVLLARGDYEKAVRAFSKAAKFDRPQSDPEKNAYLYRSLAYEKLGDEIGAETDLAKANEQCGAQVLDSWLTENHWR